MAQCVTLPPVLRYLGGSSNAQVQHGDLLEDFSNILILRVELANRMMECLSVDEYIYESVEVLL